MESLKEKIGHQIVGFVENSLSSSNFDFLSFLLVIPDYAKFMSVVLFYFYLVTQIKKLKLKCK